MKALEGLIGAYLLVSSSMQIKPGHTDSICVCVCVFCFWHLRLCSNIMDFWACSSSLAVLIAFRARTMTLSVSFILNWLFFKAFECELKAVNVFLDPWFSIPFWMPSMFLNFVDCLLQILKSCFLFSFERHPTLKICFDIMQNIKSSGEKGRYEKSPNQSCSSK